MKITKDTVVSLQFKIAEPTGKLIEESKEPMVYLHGGYNNTLPKIEEALDGQERRLPGVLDLGPQDAFGLRDESLVQVIPKTQFPPGVKVGGQLEGRVTEDGSGDGLHRDEDQGRPTVHLDGNHPLAGKALRFTLKVVGTRAAPLRPKRLRTAMCTVRTGGHHH
jgi:FKBP-type peptidyl-prolyl cis-trans isomerase SlyD